MPRSRIVYVLILAAVVRLAIFAGPWRSGNTERMFTPDSMEYLRLSHSILEEFHFEQHGRAEIFRTPGYPLFMLSGILFGKHTWLGVALVQIGLDVLLVYLTFRLGCALSTPRLGWWAALFQAITPVSAAACSRLLSDNLYTFLFLLAMLLFIRSFQAAKPWRVILAGVTIAAACYVRPVGLVMATLMFVSMLFVQSLRKYSLVFAVVLFLGVAPWVARNALEAKYWGFSSFASDSAYYYALPELKARREGIPAELIRLRADDRRRDARRDGAYPGPAAHRRAAEVAKAIRADLPGYMAIHFKGCAGFWLPGGTDVLELWGVTTGQRGTVDVLHREGILAAVRHYFGGSTGAIVLGMAMAVIPLVQYLLAGVGVVAGSLQTRLRLPPEVWLLVAIVVVTVVLPGPFGLPRYRIPVMPILNLAAAAGVVYLSDRRRKQE
ncbi:MAG: glycosyltransferase family 39 protein [Phycisphaerae bacterium]|nr:glycosyltransferase family 39 protein [Phycisphaerae bacterium]